MAKEPIPWGIYYLGTTNDQEWTLAFTVDVLTEADFARAQEIGSRVKETLKCYAVRLIKGETSPSLAREKVRALGRVSQPTIDQEIAMQARFMSWSMTGNFDWARGFEGALHTWRRMPLVEKMKYIERKEKETHDVK